MDNVIPINKKLETKVTIGNERGKFTLIVDNLPIDDDLMYSNCFTAVHVYEIFELWLQNKTGCSLPLHELIEDAKKKIGKETTIAYAGELGEVDSE